MGFSKNCAHVMATQTDCVSCLGCGEDITNRTTDRRALHGTSAEHVVNVWRAMFENVQADERQVDADVFYSLEEEYHPRRERCAESAWLLMPDIISFMRPCR